MPEHAFALQSSRASPWDYPVAAAVLLLGLAVSVLIYSRHSTTRGDGDVRKVF
jgi:hypothetical protein